jgi:uncharacterized protein (TIGR02996 family)
MSVSTATQLALEGRPCQDGGDLVKEPLMAKNRRLFTDQERSFLAAIHEDPGDDTPRLVYADWLEENGDTAQADFIRLQCEAAKGVAVWRTPPTSPQVNGLVKKYGRRWLGQGLLSGNWIDSHSRFRFQGFHRGLPLVTHFTAFEGAAVEYAGEILDLLAPHFQLSVLLRIYCTPGDNLAQMLENPILTRAQQVIIWTSSIKDQATIDVPMPAPLAKATAECFRRRKMLYIQIRNVTDEARTLLEKELSPYVVTLTALRL